MNPQINQRLVNSNSKLMDSLCKFIHKLVIHTLLKMSFVWFVRIADAVKHWLIFSYMTF